MDIFARIKKADFIRLIIGVILFVAGIVWEHAYHNAFYPVPFIAGYIILGFPVIKTALINIKNGQLLDENFLMGIATIGALSLREFSEAVGVMLFYLIGEMFEEFAVNKSRGAITEIMKIRPDYANIKGDDEQLIKVDPFDVHVGDEIVVLPGEKVPLDGEIIKGSSTFDTSAITGEPLPASLKPGDTAVSGYINSESPVYLRVINEAEESTVNKILELVSEATDKKSHSERFITKFAQIYTPAVVIGAAILVLLPTILFGIGEFHKWLYRAMVFLVISCPCALVISVPLSYFGGIGSASKRGVLIKGSNYLDNLSNIDSVVFDKTGTLTEGKFSISKIFPSNKVDAAYNVLSDSMQDVTPKNNEEKLMHIANLAESFSSHPLAVSIKNFIDTPAKTKIDGQIIHGKGCKALLDGHTILAGNKKLMDDAFVEDAANNAEGTVIHVAVDNIYAGYISFEDAIKSSAYDTIKELSSKGINTYMLTGDNEDSAKKVASTLKLTGFTASLLPDEKVDALESIMSKSPEGKYVAFIGDGINDAPSLARADIGISMGGAGTDAAIEASDIAIMDDNPSKILTSVKIAKKTKRIATENIIFALGVKGLVLILGALGMATMWAAVFADVGVAVIAITNSLRALGSIKEK